MKSRLDALLRQRELVREHAQWLDEEIAAERARTAATSGAAVTAVTPAVATTPSMPAATGASLPQVEPPAEADVKGLHNEVRRGCLLYFVLAAAALGGLIAFIYWKYDADTETAPELEPAPPAAPAAAPR